MSENLEQRTNTVKDSIAQTVVLPPCQSTEQPVTLCYQTFGDPSNPCLLSIMGFMCESVYFDHELVDMALKAGFYVVRFDNRDVGKSTSMDGHGKLSILKLQLPDWMAWGEKVPYTLYDMAEDAYHLLKHLNIEKAHVWGISMGGMIAQCIALKHPEVVRSLTLIITSSGARDLPAMTWKVFFAMLRRPKSTSREDCYEFRLRLIRDYLAGGETLTDADIAVIKDVSYQCNEAGLQRDERFLRQAAAIKRALPRDEELKKSSSEGKFPPTFILHGARDELIPVQHGRRLRDCIKDSQYLELPYMGHYTTGRCWGDAFPQIASFMNRH